MSSAAPIGPGRFYGAGAAVGVPAPQVHGVPATRGLSSGPAGRRGRGHGQRRGRGRGRGRNRSRSPTPPAPIPCKSYNDPDVANPIPPFTHSRPAGIHFERPLLRGTMIKAVEFFNLFFTNKMITNIVTHTNTYAWEHIYSGSHQSYTSPDGSW